MFFLVGSTKGNHQLQLLVVIVVRARTSIGIVIRVGGVGIVAAVLGKDEIVDAPVDKATDDDVDDDPLPQRPFAVTFVLGLVLLGLISLTLIEIWASNTVVAFGEKLDKLTGAEKNLKMEK